jgi:hypothetical protein
MLTRRTFLNRGLRGAGGIAALASAPALLAACGNSAPSSRGTMVDGAPATSYVVEPIR